MSLRDFIKTRYDTSCAVDTTHNSNKTLTDILDRKSCRKFKSDSIEKDLLNMLFATAFSSPSKSDLQQVSVIRVADKAKQQRIAELSSKTTWAAQAPEFMVWCGDSRRIRRVCEWRGHAFANDHLDAFMNAAVDTGITMQTFIIAAESVGLGCCPVSEIRDHINELSAELELPDWVFPVAGLCVGWPAEDNTVSMRLPLDITVHSNQYDDSGLLDRVAEYDQRRESVEQTPNDQQRDVARFGVSSDYGWSENRTRQYATPARIDFGEYIRKQGFGLS